MSAALTPVMLSIASGEFRSSLMNAFHFSYSTGSHRRRTKSSSASPSVTTTCASALMTATLVPGKSFRW